MYRKPFAAFGRVLYANYYDKNDVLDVAMRGHSKVILFFSDGNFTARDKATNEVVYQCEPGWFINGDFQDRLLACVANEPSVCWCYDPDVNQGYVPPIDMFVLKQGESVDLDIGTNLFLCSGTLLVNGKQFLKPQQIAVRSDTSRATALTDVYGLIFK